METIIAAEPPSDEPQFALHDADEAGLPLFERALHRVFLRPDGVRPIWRLVAAVALYNLLVFVAEALLATDPAVWAWMRSRSPRVLTPAVVIFGEGLRVAAALATGHLMSKIEDRSFAEYGLPWRDAPGRRFWQGAAYGLGLLTALMIAIGALGGFSLGRIALGDAAAIEYGASYLLAFLLVGFFEESTFRGYLQATLAQEIGFWPAALALSAAFATMHVRNFGEAPTGLLLAGCFGLLAAFSLRRTGSIWFAIAMHAAWDWGESYVYGVPNSGVLAAGHLTSASLHGPMWLTGGSVGPEGSALVFGVMAFGALGVHIFFPAKREAA